MDRTERARALRARIDAQAAMTAVALGADVSLPPAQMAELQMAAVGDTPVRQPDSGAAWSAGLQVTPGDAVTYGGKTYTCLQAHITLGTWTPDVTPALWAVQEAPGASAWQPGVQYKAGDRRTHQGKTYECLQAHTSQTGWEPPGTPALWKEITP